MFIHDAVLESVVCGNTQIPAEDFRTTFDSLKQTIPDTNESGFQAQFNVCILCGYVTIQFMYRRTLQ